MKHLAPFIALSLIGCASAVPAEKISATESSIRAAEEVGATNVPQASLHLQMAKEETEHAQKYLKDGDNKHGEGLLMRAQADAELAVALAREEPIKNEAQQMVEKARALQQQSV